MSWPHRSLPQPLCSAPLLSLDRSLLCLLLLAVPRALECLALRLTPSLKPSTPSSLTHQKSSVCIFLASLSAAVRVCLTWLHFPLPGALHREVLSGLKTCKRNTNYGHAAEYYAAMKRNRALITCCTLGQMKSPSQKSTHA